MESCIPASASGHFFSCVRHFSELHFFCHIKRRVGDGGKLSVCDRVGGGGSTRIVSGAGVGGFMCVLCMIFMP